MKLIKKPSFEYKIVSTCVTIALVPTIFLLILLSLTDISNYLKAMMLLLVTSVLSLGGLFIWRRVRNQLRTTTNIVEALFTGDISMRPSSAITTGALAELNQVINHASDKLAQQKQVSKEHHIAMAKVLEHINVAVICLDEYQAVSLANPNAKHLFQLDDSIIGMPASYLGIEQPLIKQPTQKVVTLTINHSIAKRVYLQTDSYQLSGKTYTLIFLNDIQQLLQNEERNAWQKLLRVLSHEINNSLAPIASIGESLSSLITNHPLSNEINDDLSDGLAIITQRAITLERFIKEYQQLTRLPEPKKQLFSLQSLLNELTELFHQTQVKITNDKDISIFADHSQLTQVMVNLIKNSQQAVEQEQNCQLLINWQIAGEFVQIELTDNGCGLSNSDNLFVPFYTTKAGGSGIGLALSRQIMFNHGGDLTLKNRSEQPGVTATLLLPCIAKSKK